MAKWFDWLKERMLIALDVDEKSILEIEVNRHLGSERYRLLHKANEYYRNHTDIERKMQDVSWKSNSKLRLGLFRKLVDQKVGYLLSKAPSVMYGNDSEEELKVKEFIDEFFDEHFLRNLKSVGRDAVIKGVSYGLVYYDEEGSLRMTKIPGEQVIPFYADERREVVDAFLRIYNQEVYTLLGKKQEIHVEYWDTEGITYYKWESGHLQPNKAYDGIQPHFRYMDETGQVHNYNWERVPLIVFKYNENEQSFLDQVKSIIDNLELQASVNADLLADIPKFIYILKGYGGEELETFLSQLNLYKVIKVRDGSGGVDKLQADINTEAVESEIARSRKMLYEAGRAIDTQDENLGNASGQALKWRFTDLDLDANDFENGLQSAIIHLMWFVVNHIKNRAGLVVDMKLFHYTFNRDVITNESEAIQDAQNSVGILDARTIREQHPWYTPEVEARLEEENKQNAEKQDDYNFNSHGHDHPPEEGKESKEKE